MSPSEALALYLITLAASGLVWLLAKLGITGWTM